MPRPPRIEFENAWYHVMNRGAGRRPIFPDDSARNYFLELLSEIKAEYRIEIHAYCLMGNHYHLLVRTPHANLNLAMQKLSSAYTRQHNRLMKTDGPLFKGRYKAILIAEESYLAQVSRYIHRNPVEAKLVKSALDYCWSSFPAYCEPSKSQSWLSMDKSIMQVSPRADRREYLQFVENPLAPSMSQFYRSKQLPGVLGSKEARRLVENHTGYQREWHPEKRLSLPELTNWVAKSFEVSSNSILLSKRGSPNRPRAVAMYLAQTAGKYPVADLADYFGVGSSGVTQTIHQLKRTLATQHELQCTIENLKQMLLNDSV